MNKSADENIIYVSINNGNKAILTFPKHNIKTEAYIGKNGATENKVEGDGKTPIGRFKLGKAFGTHKKEEILYNDYTEITKDLYWVDDSNSRYYNTLVDISKVEKDWNSAEHLIKYKEQYEYGIEIKSNPENIPNKGSAIFLHCKKSDYTLGCVSIDKLIMKQILNCINENTEIEITQKLYQ